MSCVQKQPIAHEIVVDCIKAVVTLIAFLKIMGNTLEILKAFTQIYSQHI